MLSKESAKTLKTIDFLLHGCHLQTREVRRETPSIIDQINTQLVLFFIIQTQCFSASSADQGEMLALPLS